MAPDGYRLATTPDGRGDGVVATRNFETGETVVVGTIERRLDRNHSHATQVGESAYVQLGGLGAKVNHSCNPNCGIRVNATGAPDLIARQAIAEGEEITFDYAMRNYSVDYFPGPCRCGETICRKRITGWRDLPEERRAAYAGSVGPYLLELDRDLARSPLRPGAQVFCRS